MLKDTLKRKNNCNIRKRNISLHRILQSVVFRNIFVFLLVVPLLGINLASQEFHLLVRWAEDCLRSVDYSVLLLAIYGFMV